MASFFSSLRALFGGSASSSSGEAAAAVEPVSQIYEDCLIVAVPIKEGNQFRLAGRIERVVAGETLSREFIRADVFASMEDAVESTFRKARQIVDQSGPSLFADGEARRQV